MITTAVGLSALLLVVLQFTYQNQQQSMVATDSKETIAQEANTIATGGEAQQEPLHYQVAPALVSVGRAFALYKGIKDVLDNLIVSADSTDKNSIILMAQDWCAKQDLSEAGCASFEALFARYIDYKLALANHETGTASPQDSLAQIRNRLQALNDLRYEWFSEEEIAALFSDDQQLNHQALARRQIAMDKDLSREQKIQLLAEHLQQLPDQQRAPLEPTLQMHSLEQIKNEYTDKQLRLLEVETQFGYEAAQRLEKTWQKQETFQNKLDEIAQQYLALRADESLTLQKQQVAFLEQHFSGNELRRAKAILKSY